MRRTTKKLLALGAVASLGLAACGDDEVIPAQSGEASAMEETTTTVAGEATDAAGGGEAEVDPTTDDAASQLRADLTTLLQEHVHLLAMVAEASLDAEGEDDPAVEAALAAVEENSTALGEVLATVPSVDDPDAFVEPWSEHVDLLAERARAVAAGDAPSAESAAADYEDFQQSVADFFDEVTDGEILADEFFGELEMHVTSMMALFDSMAAEDGEAPTLLGDATGQMDTVAATIASALVAANADEIAGDPASVPSETRAGLTSALVEHAYLVGVVVEQVAETGGDAAAPAVQDAVAALDESAVDLANSIAGTAGNDRREVFLDLWRQHSQAFADHAAARASGDTAAADEALAALQGFIPAAGAFFEEMTSGTATADALAGSLETHISTVTAATDAFVAGDAGAYTQLRAAAQHMPVLAAELARAIVAASDAQDPPAEAGEGETTDEAGTAGGTGTGGTDSGGTESGSGDSGTGDAGATSSP